MIFETLMQSTEKGELILVDGGYCRHHLRRDGQITIYEIIVLPNRRDNGIATAMLERLKLIDGAKTIFAKCPANLESNGWYSKVGFNCVGTETTKSGRELNLWQYQL